MLDLPSDERPLQRFELKELEKVVRGKSAPPPLAVDAAIGLTAPFVLPLTASLVAEDKELAAFWEAERDRYRFDYLTFRCSLEAAEGIRFKKAWVEVTLDPVAAEGGPTAWSMAPKVVENIEKVSQSAKLGAKFSVVTADSTMMVERPVKVWSLRAGGEHSAKPYWEFRDQGATSLSGTFRLNFVVRTGRTLAARGRITARAVIAKRTFLIFSSSGPADHPPASSLTWTHASGQVQTHRPPPFTIQWRRGRRALRRLDFAVPDG